MTSIETPASFGVHGPGEITILSGLRVSISPIVCTLPLASVP